ncbi:MAG: hypothetical protein GDA56_18105 [Hormoscilla sp. GM7CHS1pb]|nr:hypothetical protein [Hormoscilla sp. GM7CHS1pb]
MLTEIAHNYPRRERRSHSRFSTRTIITPRDRDIEHNYPSKLRTKLAHMSNHVAGDRERYYFFGSGRAIGPLSQRENDLTAVRVSGAKIAAPSIYPRPGHERRSPSRAVEHCTITSHRDI